jgi:hypothetical protein
VKKNIIFFLIPIIVILVIFGTAVTCNMCGFGITTPTSAAEAQASETIEDQSGITSDESDTETVYETPQETVAKETKSTDEPKTTDSQKEAPASSEQPKVEKTYDFIASEMGTVTPKFGSEGPLCIGDSEENLDLRGRFAFDVSILSGKEITYAKLKLINPLITGIVDFKGPILIYYNDFLPDITVSDYFNNNVYGSPETFAWNADPIEFSNTFLKKMVKERADAGIKLQFGIGFQSAYSGGAPDTPEFRYYAQNNCIILSVKYKE